MLAQVCVILLFFMDTCQCKNSCLGSPAQHTHTAFNGRSFGTTQVSRYQKGKTNLDFTEARDSEWQWHQLGHIQVCTSLQTDNHASTSPVSILVKLVKIIFQNQRNKHANSALWLLETSRRTVTDQLKPRREQLSWSRAWPTLTSSPWPPDLDPDSAVPRSVGPRSWVVIPRPPGAAGVLCGTCWALSQPPLPVYTDNQRPDLLNIFRFVEMIKMKCKTEAKSWTHFDGFGTKLFLF